MGGVIVQKSFCKMKCRIAPFLLHRVSAPYFLPNTENHAQCIFHKSIMLRSLLITLFLVSIAKSTEIVKE